MREVYDFIKKCDTYYLATIEGDQPRVRPFGTVDLFEDRIYIQSSRSDGIAEKMSGTKVEICAFDGETWMRVAATLVEDPRVAPKQHMIDAYPNLLSMYRADDDRLQVFYLSGATATFSSFISAPQVMTFEGVSSRE